MRANRYLHIAVIGVTVLFFVLCQTATAGSHNKRWGPPKKPGNHGLPGCLAKVSKCKFKVWKLRNIVATQQETIDQQAARIEELEAMLENFAAVPQTGQTTSWGERDDGELQMGVQWPDPRFTDNGDGTVTDHLTGLIWLKDANCLRVWRWSEALEASNNLAHGQCMLSDGSAPGDWRLPNVNEQLSLMDYSHYGPSLPMPNPFIIDGNIENFWTSSMFQIAVDHGDCWVWTVYFGQSGMRPVQCEDDEFERIFHKVWTVRDAD